MNYETIFSRNIGLISEEQQKAIQKSKILICGLGGMGGVAAEVLTRMGVGKLVLVDHDRYDYVNLNRQMYSSTETIGEFKVEVLKRNFLKINPDIQVVAYSEAVSLENVEKILEDVDIVINGMDEFFPSIILERLAHSRKIPIIDAWITPFASVFVIKGEDPHWEEYLEFCTVNKKISDITSEDLVNNLSKEVNHTFSFFNPYEYISKDVVQQVIDKKRPRPSFCIVVYLSGVFMANEAFKLICGYPTVDFKGVIFNQYSYDSIKIK